MLTSHPPPRGPFGRSTVLSSQGAGCRATPSPFLRVKLPSLESTRGTPKRHAKQRRLAVVPRAASTFETGSLKIIVQGRNVKLTDSIREFAVRSLYLQAAHFSPLRFELASYSSLVFWSRVLLYFALVSSARSSVVRLDVESFVSADSASAESAICKRAGGKGEESADQVRVGNQGDRHQAVGCWWQSGQG